MANQATIDTLNSLPVGTTLFVQQGKPFPVYPETTWYHIGTYRIAFQGLPAPEENQPGRPGQILELDLYLNQG